MTEFTSFRPIIELWSSREAMADEIGNGCKAAQVSKWWQRDRIPEDWWSGVLATDTARQEGLTADLMVNLAARAPSIEPAEARA